MTFFTLYLSSEVLLDFGDAVGHVLTRDFSFGKGLIPRNGSTLVNRCLAFHPVGVSSKFLIHAVGHWS